MILAKALTRRGLLAGGGLMAVSACARALAGGKTRVVVELFTSQGCSSCPAADAFLGELAKRDDVLTLSLNVDYWDYLGWRDTLASADHTKRQRDYAQRRGDGKVYTPQMVIDGVRHAVGSRRQDVLAAIEEQAAGADGSRRVAVGLQERNGEILVEVAGAPTDRLRQSSTVWVMMVTPRQSVTIERGENTGRTIDYYNVVKKMMPAGMWNGEAVTLTLPKADLVADSATACAALLQVGGVGPIIGAAWMPGPAS